LKEHSGEPEANPPISWIEHPYPAQGPIITGTQRVGLVSIEDLCVMLDEMGIDVGAIDIDRLLEMGTLMERTLGRRLRSESILSGRIPKTPRYEFKRPKLMALKEKGL